MSKPLSDSDLEDLLFLSSLVWVEEFLPKPLTLVRTWLEKQKREFQKMTHAIQRLLQTTLETTLETVQEWPRIFSRPMLLHLLQLCCSEHFYLQTTHKLFCIQSPLERLRLSVRLLEHCSSKSEKMETS